MKRLAVTTLPNTETQHSHEHHQLVIPVAGLADFTIEGQKGRITHSVGCVIPSRAEHSFAGKSGNELILLNVDDEDLNPETRTMFACPAWFRIDRSLMELILQVSHELARFPEDELLSQALCDGLLQSLRLRFAQSWQPVASATLAMDQICEYIASHLDKPLRVPELAAMAGMAESRFYSAFRGFTHQTPHQYILEQRLASASHLLEATNTSLADIAEITGFNNQSLMTRAMREKLGITPLQLRKQSLLALENEVFA
ncbi:AraC family transcriptional regulator [Parendozoicomonas haliclonae]|uniref:HTH-type transcriptional activator Btr n=1 Tax=Parendozoicomonas haliclonae TaxID=1960125 RepID=A0A1X7AK68_9GAMM|nr:AraC family transcriptional regulator [Parendozoicomonas haliclonae]SMA43128.1 HTH-type transcriptional activator Btr [Parendozoicomonas haliclonae]